MKKLAFYFTLFPLMIFAFSNISSNMEKDKSRLIPYADYLFWKTEEDGLDFLYDDEIQNSNKNGPCGDIKRGTYSWQSGFRIGLKYQFKDCEDWALNGEYGYIGPQNNQKIVNADKKQMSSTFQMPDGFIIEKAQTDTKLRCSIANFVVQKCIKSSQIFKINISSGLSGIWIKREWTLKFIDHSNYTRIIEPTWNFKGIGIKTGADFEWRIKGDFYWSGSSNIAAIYGNSDNWMKTYDLPSNTIYENSHLDDFRIVTNIQFLLGPAWQKCYKTYLFKVCTYFETNLWQNLSQTNRSIYQATPSNPQSNFTKNNLQMYGLTLFASINF